MCVCARVLVRPLVPSSSWGLWSVQKWDLPPIAFFDLLPPHTLCVSASLSSNPCTPYVIHPPLGFNSCAFNDIQYKFIILIDRHWVRSPDSADKPCLMNYPCFVQLYNVQHHIESFFFFKQSIKTRFDWVDWQVILWSFKFYVHYQVKMPNICKWQPSNVLIWEVFCFSSGTVVFFDHISIQFINRWIWPIVTTASFTSPSCVIAFVAI